MKQQQIADQTNKSLVDQAGQLAGTPVMDPNKNPQLAEQAGAVQAVPYSIAQPPQ